MINLQQIKVSKMINLHHKKVNKLKFHDFYKTKQKSIEFTNFSQSTKSPTFHSEERLANLERGRERFVGLIILLVYGVAQKYR